MKTVCVWMMAVGILGAADTKKTPPAPAPPEAATAAVEASKIWAAGTSLPLQGREGKVMFVFGEGLPAITCAPLRVCVIELEAGERLTGEPKIGDSVRWDLSPALVGAEPNATTLIVIKPRFPNLDTNLLLATDRRAYYIRLLSSASEYVARIGFTYPTDSGQWARAALNHQVAAAVEAQKHDKVATEAKTRAAVAPKQKPSQPGSYKIIGNDKTLRPVSVEDDGQKTYIKMPDDVWAREWPSLFVLGPDKKLETVNFRVQGTTFVVDRLFDEAELVLGVGKKARKVRIVREAKDGVATTATAGQ